MEEGGRVVSEDGMDAGGMDISQIVANVTEGRSTTGCVMIEVEGKAEGADEEVGWDCKEVDESEGSDGVIMVVTKVEESCCGTATEVTAGGLVCWE